MDDARERKQLETQEINGKSCDDHHTSRVTDVLWEKKIIYTHMNTYT